jgi:hypothetical protein
MSYQGKSCQELSCQGFGDLKTCDSQRQILDSDLGTPQQCNEAFNRGRMIIGRQFVGPKWINQTISTRDKISLFPPGTLNGTPHQGLGERSVKDTNGIHINIKNKK